MGSADTAKPELPEISQAADEGCHCEIQWKKFVWHLFYLDWAKSLTDNYLLKLKYISLHVTYLSLEIPIARVKLKMEYCGEHICF